MRHRLAITLLTQLALVLCGCGRAVFHASSSNVAQANASGNVLEGGIDQFVSGVDYFPDKISFRHAKQLRIEYRGNYKLATFTPNVPGDVLRYILVQRGTPIPDLPEIHEPLTHVFEVPLQRIALGSMRYGGAADLLGVIDRLSFVSGLRAITTRSILDRISSGQILEAYSTELLMDRNVDGIMGYYSSRGESLAMQKDLELGLNRIAMAEHLEETPLAKSEWIKFFGMFFNRERFANDKFDEIEKAYVETASLVRAKLENISSKPKVLVNYQVGDAWPVYGGKNAFARLIEDAGGDYLFRKLPYRHSNYELPFEAVYDRGSDADVWIVGPDLSSAFADGKPRFDERLKRLHASNKFFVSYNPTAERRNPWWDGALISPHIELLDYVKVLHPELVPEHQFKFLRQIH